MTTSNSRLAYDDAFEFMERAFEAAEKGKILRRKFYEKEDTIENRGAAIQFRARIHQARVIDRKDNKELYPEKEHPLHGRSKYDILSAQIRLEGDCIFLYMRKISLNNYLIEEVDDLPPREPQTVEYEAPKMIESPDKIARRF